MIIDSRRRDHATVTARSVLALVGLFVALAVPSAQAANLNFTYHGPAGYMNEPDWEMFRAEARTMLNSGEDDKTYRWTNEETGTSGSFTSHQTFEKDALPCRVVTVTLAAGPAQGSQVMTVCKQTDDTWKIVR